MDRIELTKHVKLLQTSLDLIEGEKKIYGSRNRCIAVGAQLALEWQAYTMLRKLYDGARNYMAYWTNEDEFHEACEYFYAHIGETEKEHKKESLRAANRYLKDKQSFEDIKKGFFLHLDLIQKFWIGIEKKMQRR